MTCTTLFLSLFFFIVIQPIHAMDDEKKLSLEEYRKSPRALNYAKQEISPKNLTINLNIPEIDTNQFNTKETSPKISPKIIKTEKSPKATPRKLSVESNRKESPKRSPRNPHIINNSDILAFTDNSNTINTVILSDLPDLPRLPRSRSYNPEYHSHKQHDNIVHRRNIKSRSTNDKLTPLTRKTSDQNLLASNNTNSSQSTIAPTTTNNTNSATINDAPLSARSSKEYSMGQLLLRSSGALGNLPHISLTKSSKNAVLKKNNLIELVRCTDMEVETQFNLIKECINNANINEQNIGGMTALHLAALNKRRNIIELLLLNPTLDSTIKDYNTKPQTASEMLKGEDNCGEIRKLLFARITLDMAVMRETFVMLMKLHINKQPINNTCISETIKIIERSIEKTENSQGSSALPEDALLPAYATDKFIEKMIYSRIPQDQQAILQLISVIHKKITILLDGEIDKKIISDSALEIIKKYQKKSYKKLCLPAYADYTFIFDVILSYIKQAKISEIKEAKK